MQRFLYAEFVCEISMRTLFHMYFSEQASPQRRASLPTLRRQVCLPLSLARSLSLALAVCLWLSLAVCLCLSLYLSYLAAAEPGTYIHCTYNGDDLLNATT